MLVKLKQLVVICLLIIVALLAFYLIWRAVGLSHNRKSIRKISNMLSGSSHLVIKRTLNREKIGCIFKTHKKEQAKNIGNGFAEIVKRNWQKVEKGTWRSVLSTLIVCSLENGQIVHFNFTMGFNGKGTLNYLDSTEPITITLNRHGTHKLYLQLEVLLRQEELKKLPKNHRKIN